MKSYYVRQKKKTNCVPGSERISVAKNGSYLLKCTCAECGITKTSFMPHPNKTRMGLISDRIIANADIKKLKENFQIRKSKMSDDQIRSIEESIKGQMEKRKKIDTQL